MDRQPPLVQTFVGLLIAGAGVSDLMQYDSPWLKALFVLVVTSGLFNAAMGRRRRNAP
jgi:hypothetical protein